jgi:hypothetical protein
MTEKEVILTALKRIYAEHQIREYMNMGSEGGTSIYVNSKFDDEKEETFGFYFDKNENMIQIWKD